MYIHIYTYTHIFIKFLCVFVAMSTHRSMNIHSCIHMYICLCTCIFICICISESCAHSYVLTVLCLCQRLCSYCMYICRVGNYTSPYTYTNHCLPRKMNVPPPTAAPANTEAIKDHEQLLPVFYITGMAFGTKQPLEIPNRFRCNSS